MEKGEEREEGERTKKEEDGGGMPCTWFGMCSWYFGLCSLSHNTRSTD